MRKSITNFIRIFIKKEYPRPLGRWNIDYCNTKLYQKVDLSNEDHCGPCGQYIITKTTKDYKNDEIIKLYTFTKNKPFNNNP
jgi:hypothetical protein